MALEKVLALDATGVIEKEIDTGSGASGVATKQSISLTAGQTSVTVPGGYTAAGVIVFLNGSYLSPAEYTATGSPTIVLAVPAPSTGSVLDVITFVSDGLSMVTSAGYAIMTAADAATQRTALGLGKAAVADILGAVAQSGGIPTGAIIERGSNSNGEYVKFADGTMITITPERLTGQITTVEGPFYVTATLGPYQLPAAFVGKPKLLVSNTSASARLIFSPAISGLDFFVLARATIPLTDTYSYEVVSVGRWF